jgi:hypothetical protein
MPCGGDLLEQRIDVRRLAHLESQRHPTMLGRWSQTGMHARDDLFVVEGQLVAAAEFYLDMRSLRFGTSSPSSR